MAARPLLPLPTGWLGLVPFLAVQLGLWKPLDVLVVLSGVVLTKVCEIEKDR